ncbi:hypothetical protein, partial [Campylobacter rectus]
PHQISLRPPPKMPRNVRQIYHPFVPIKRSDANFKPFRSALFCRQAKSAWFCPRSINQKGKFDGPFRCRFAEFKSRQKQIIYPNLKCESSLNFGEFYRAYQI